MLDQVITKPDSSTEVHKAPEATLGSAPESMTTAREANISNPASGASHFGFIFTYRRMQPDAE